MTQITLTPGEPAGIGPDITVMLAQQALPFELVAIADADLLMARAKQLNLPLTIKAFDPEIQPQTPQPQTLTVWHVPLKTPAHCGQLNPVNAEYVLETLTIATEQCLQKTFAALVTGPVHKGVINQAGIVFSGHTEFLAKLTNTKQVVMMLMTQQLKVALATTHLPLREVAAAITQTSLTKTLEILHQALQQQFKINKPHILVCGLNPHAGESGHLGDEEIKIITPVLNILREQGISLTGPLPADTLFTPKHLQTADAVLAMYHDQGLPVLKYQGFGQAVNMTLGLPIIRTSVDHGTALTLAGSGNAKAESLHTAVLAAAKLL